MGKYIVRIYNSALELEVGINKRDKAGYALIGVTETTYHYTAIFCIKGA